MTCNDDQRAFWSGPSGQSWVEHQTRQDALLESIARRVVEDADLAPGARVADIGCGTGALSEMAAVAVGAAGHVLATDISAPLLARAGERLAPHPQAVTRLGDAASLDWPAPGFDCVISRFGVMFFNDPPAAFAHIGRALRPGGRMVFAAWAPLAENPYWHIGARVAGARLGGLPPGPANAPGPMGLASVAYARTVFAAAGFPQAEITPTKVAMDYPYSAEDLADLMVRVGSATRIINAHGASEADVAAIRDGILAELKPFEQAGGGVSVPAVINLIEVHTD